MLPTILVIMLRHRALGPFEPSTIPTAIYSQLVDLANEPDADSATVEEI